MTAATYRRPTLSGSERRQLCALAASVWPVCIRLADRIDPKMAPAKDRL
jgi:hypothetical protein